MVLQQKVLNQAVKRNNVRDVSGVDEYIHVGDINKSTDWQRALAGVDTVIHLAARVHIMNDPAADSVEAFRKVNVLGTARLARMAARAGVKRFIFISSVKVNGVRLCYNYEKCQFCHSEGALRLRSV